jgi:hypothetical protein
MPPRTLRPWNGKHYSPLEVQSVKPTSTSVTRDGYFLDRQGTDAIVSAASRRCPSVHPSNVFFPSLSRQGVRLSRRITGRGQRGNTLSPVRLTRRGLPTELQARKPDSQEREWLEGSLSNCLSLYSKVVLRLQLSGEQWQDGPPEAIVRVVTVSRRLLFLLGLTNWT